MKLNVNGRVQDVDVEPDMPLLWEVRAVPTGAFRAATEGPAR